MRLVNSVCLKGMSYHMVCPISTTFNCICGESILLVYSSIVMRLYGTDYNELCKNFLVTLFEFDAISNICTPDKINLRKKQKCFIGLELLWVPGDLSLMPWEIWNEWCWLLMFKFLIRVNFQLHQQMYTKHFYIL